MTRQKRFISDLIQGLAALVILYYVMCGDPTRSVTLWIKNAHPGFMASSPVFLLCLLAILFLEGAGAAMPAGDAGPSPFRRAFGYYIAYWKVCVPLTLAGYLLFSGIVNSNFYSPMFLNPSALNISRAIFALTNNLHEGAWLASCVALCAFSASWSVKLAEKQGKAWGYIAMLAGIAVLAALYLFIMPFHYHKATFPVAALAGAAAYFAGFELCRRFEGAADRVTKRSEALEKSRFTSAVTAPVRYIGRNWLSFWFICFFIALYFYNVPQSVYTGMGTLPGAYLVFLAVCLSLLFAINWGCQQFVAAFKRSKWIAAAVVPVLGLPVILHFMLEASVDYGMYTGRTALQWPFYAVISFMSVMCVVLLFKALTGRWFAAGVITVALLTLLAVANHYTMKYHGTLLTAEDLKNLQTAANVAGGYDFSIDGNAGRLLLLGGAGLLCCVASWLLGRKARSGITASQRWTGRGVCLVTAAMFSAVFYFAPAPLVQRNDNAWNWLEMYAKIGFFSGTVESTMANLNFRIRKPDGYTDEHIAQLAMLAGEDGQAQDAAVAADRDYPDIIMILNETWYDLNEYIDVNADADYMRNYRALDNAIKGLAEVPLTGGGTNSVEYEMLTSNSVSLINAYAPFNRLDMTDQVALPNYLKGLGYATLAAHPHYGQNYQRSYRWDQLDFDEIHFIEDFTDLEYYGERKGVFCSTDVSVMRNFIRFYNEMPEDQPRFGFLITIQNHGGWDQNPPELATVHASTATDDEKLANKINEYLSCVSLTDEMIAFMQECFEAQYAQTGRRVIICMVGDHSPSMISSMKSLCKWSDDDYAERKGKSTPYFIWANYPLELEGIDLAGTEDMDLCSLMPTMLDVTDVPLSAYYRKNIEMRSDVCVFTNVGTSYKDEGKSDLVFCDRQGEYHNVDEDSPVARKVMDYFCMEYNAVEKRESREDALFSAVDLERTETGNMGDAH